MTRLALATALALMAIASVAQAEPYFYDAYTKEQFAVYRDNPSALEISEIANFHGWLIDPIKTCEDFKGRLSSVVGEETDRMSMWEYSRCATLDFLSAWADTPDIPAPESEQVILAFAYGIEAHLFSDMFFQIKRANIRPVGSLADELSAALWEWKDGSLSISDDYEAHTITAIAWFKDRRDGRHKALVRYVEAARHGNLLLPRPLLIEERGDTAELTGYAEADLRDWDKAGRPAP